MPISFLEKYLRSLPIKNWVNVRQLDSKNTIQENKDSYYRGSTRWKTLKNQPLPWNSFTSNIGFQNGGLILLIDIGDTSTKNTLGYRI